MPESQLDAADGFLTRSAKPWWFVCHTLHFKTVNPPLMPLREVV